MEYVENSKANIPAVRKGFVVVAVAEDRALAKDYKNWLGVRGLDVDVQRCEGLDDGKYEYYISVNDEDVDQAIKLIQSRNPADYFYDSLFSGDENDIDEIY